MRAGGLFKFILPAIFTIVGQQAAFAAPVTTTALALAAVIARHSPTVRFFDKRTIARLFGGKTNFGFAPNVKIFCHGRLRRLQNQQC
jgi:hypothetical protein